MRKITLGNTEIATVQNGFGALPLQRDDMELSVRLLQRAYEGGITFFDTARAYSDSEEKIGAALSDVRQNIYIATKTMARTPDEMKSQLDTSLRKLRTDYIDIYQFHCAARCFAPEDGTGMYELMEDFKRQGIIRHIGITAHKIGVAEECIESGLYETLQFPFSCLSSERELALADKCREHNMGFIAMKALAGGIITDSRLAYAFIGQYDNVLPIWGIQRENELDEWLFLYGKNSRYDGRNQKRYSCRQAGTRRKFLPRLRLLYALPYGNTDKQLRKNVSHAAQSAVRKLAFSGMAE